MHFQAARSRGRCGMPVTQSSGSVKRGEHRWRRGAQPARRTTEPTSVQAKVQAQEKSRAYCWSGPRGRATTANRAATRSVPRLQGPCRPRGAGWQGPVSGPADERAGGAPVARETADQVETREAPPNPPQWGCRKRPRSHSVHEHAARKRTGRQAHEARLPWAQPARQAARVGAEWHETQTPSPADKWDK